MSRIGNRIIQIPEGVTVEEKDGNITVTGPKGTLTMPSSDKIKLKVENNELKITRDDDRSIATDLDNPPKPIINGKVEEGAAKNKANNITNATVSGPRKKERPILGHRLDKSARKKED